MTEKKDKYPWFKSIFRKKPKKEYAAGVYAGPEQMARRPGAKKPSDDEEPIDVYAGPEFFERDPEEEPVPPKKPECRPEPEKPVYAGPEYFGSAKRVYEGPERFQQMMVYAGPEYFRSRSEQGAGAFAQAPAEDPDTVCEELPEEIPEGSVKCPSCGYVYPANLQFCPECGTDTKGPELLA